jgi:predicted MFS family arabinose efflux permease
MLADLFPRERRATAMGIYSLGVPAGLFLGLVVGGFLNQSFGWRVTLLSLGLPGLAVALLVRLTIREPARDASPSMGQIQPFWQTLRQLSGRGTFVHISLGCALTSMVSASANTWLPSLFIRNFQLQTGEIGLWLGLIVGLPGAIGIYVGGWLSDRLGQHDLRWSLWFVTITLILATPLGMISFAMPSARMTFIMLILPMMLGNCFIATTFAQVQNITEPHMRATASALLFLVLNLIGWGIGPQLAGFLSDILAPLSGTRAINHALMIITLGNIWAALHYYFAGKSLPHALKAVENPREL